MALPVFDLTPMTRGAASDRKTVVATFEVKTRHFVILVASMIPSMILVASFWGLIREYAILIWPLVTGAIFFFTEGRTKSGMQVRYWEALRNRTKSMDGRFFIGTTEVHPLNREIREVHRSSVPVPRAGSTAELADSVTAGDIFTEPTRATRRGRKSKPAEAAQTGWEDIAPSTGHSTNIPDRGSW